MLELDAAVESLLRDPQYLLRLYHKVLLSILRCDRTSSVRSLSTAFKQIDMRYSVRGRVPKTDVWFLKGILRQIMAANTISDRELSLLLAALPLDEYGGGVVGGVKGDTCVSPVLLLFCLRLMCPMRTLLFRELLRAIDTKSQRHLPSESACGMALVKHIRSGERGGLCVLERDPLLDYLTQSYALTLSEAMFLIDYCSVGTSSTESTVSVDADYFYIVLFHRPLPTHVHFPLLMSVFTETVCDPNRPGHSGTLALVGELRRLLPKLVHGSPDMKQVDASVDLDSELQNRCLTPETFEELCKSLTVDLSFDEVRRLFYYLRDAGPREVVSVGTLMREFARHFPPVGKSLFCIVREAVLRYLVKAGDMLTFPRLHLALPDGALSIGDFIAAFRAAGVPDAVGDVELEWLRFEGKDRVRLVRLICGRLPTSREALVRQLFEHIRNLGGVSDGHGCVKVERVLALFHPEKAGDACVGGGDKWRHVMSCFFEKDLCETLTFENFVYFWQAVSAGCSDDSVFTMILWRCFDMHVSR